MPTFQFEAMDAQGQEIKDVIEAPTQDEAQATIRSMGYFVTKIALQKQSAADAAKTARKKSFAMGGAGGKKMVTFTRQLSILQDAGMPILRSLKILEGQSKPGALKNALMDVCDEIEGGATLSEAFETVISALAFDCGHSPPNLPTSVEQTLLTSQKLHFRWMPRCGREGPH
jgi:type IV pilus assembly protein PilC